MTTDRRIIEGIEVCRLGSDDLPTRDFEYSHNRLPVIRLCRSGPKSCTSLMRQSDQVISEVSVPVGLQQRLLNTLPNQDEWTRCRWSRTKEVIKKALSYTMTWLSTGLAVAACLAIATGIALLAGILATNRGPCTGWRKRLSSGV